MACGTPWHAVARWSRAVTRTGVGTVTRRRQTKFLAPLALAPYAMQPALGGSGAHGVLLTNLDQAGR